MYESGSSTAFMDERTGAASLWMVSTRMGDAAVRSGKSERLKRPFMMTGRREDVTRERKIERSVGCLS